MAPSNAGGPVGRPPLFQMRPFSMFCRVMLAAIEEINNPAQYRYGHACAVQFDLQKWARRMSISQSCAVAERYIDFSEMITALDPQ